MSDVCGDNRFEVIAEAKKELLESTNIEMRPDEMSVLDSFLFRCWQMGWLKQYETYEFCDDGENPCKEYDHEKHCCHRWTKVIRTTIDEIKNAEPERKSMVWKPAKGRPAYEKGICSCGYVLSVLQRDYIYCPMCGMKLEWGEE